MGDAIKVTVKETAATKAAIQRLKVMKVTPEMKKAMMKATSPAVPALRSAIRQLPSQNQDVHAPPGLRTALAKSAGRKTLSTKSTVTVMVMMKGGGLANLARAVEGAIPWVHPTFDNEPIVEQPAMPYFTHTMEKIQALVAVRMKEAQIKVKKQMIP